MKLVLMFLFCRLGTQEALFVWGGGIVSHNKVLSQVLRFLHTSDTCAPP